MNYQVIIVAGLFAEAIKGSDASRIVRVFIRHFVWKHNLLRVLPGLNGTVVVFDIVNHASKKPSWWKSAGASIPRSLRENEVRSS